MKRRFGLTRVLFEDEIFGMDRRWLDRFAPLYREQIGVPFEAYLYPSRNVGTLLPMLESAGLAACCVSLQSGSGRIQREVFQRVFDREAYLKTVRLCR